MNEILCVALGGSLGAVTRYLIGMAAIRFVGINFPYGTLLVNLAGCFFIGLFMTFVGGKINFNPLARLFVTAGFLGGLTTFSSFTYETVCLLQSGQYLSSFFNAFLNIFLGLFAVFAGIFTASAL